MVVRTVTERVLGGLFEAPHTRLKRMTVEYEHGGKLVLSEDILAVFLAELTAMYNIFMAMQAQAELNMQRQNHLQPPSQEVTPVHGGIEELRRRLQETKPPTTAQKKQDTKKEPDDKGE